MRFNCINNCGGAPHGTLSLDQSAALYVFPLLVSYAEGARGLTEAKLCPQKRQAPGQSPPGEFSDVVRLGVLMLW